MKLLICGGRKYYTRREMFPILDSLHAEHVVTEVIEGGQEGADKLGREWAKKNGIGGPTVEAEWKRLGPAAGPIRNAKMLELKPDAVAAFSGSYGTANMVRQAIRAGVKVFDFRRLCRTGKTRYTDEAAGQRALDRVKRERSASGAKQVESGAYCCEFCGGFHLTSHPNVKNTAGVDSAPAQG